MPSQATGLDGVRDDRLYGLGTVCAVLDVHRGTAYKLIRAGELPAVRVGSAWRVLGAELRRMCNAPPPAAPAETARQRAGRAAAAVARLKVAKTA